MGRFEITISLFLIFSVLFGDFVLARPLWMALPCVLSESINCGSYDHALKEAQQKKDKAVIDSLLRSNEINEEYDAANLALQNNIITSILEAENRNNQNAINGNHLVTRSSAKVANETGKSVNTMVKANQNTQANIINSGAKSAKYLTDFAAELLK